MHIRPDVPDRLKMDTTEEMLMKKMTAFVMALALVCTNVPANLHVQTGTETVYAAQETAINSEQDLIAMQNNPKGKSVEKRLQDAAIPEISQ